MCRWSCVVVDGWVVMMGLASAVALGLGGGGWGGGCMGVSWDGGWCGLGWACDRV